MSGLSTLLKLKMSDGMEVTLLEPNSPMLLLEIHRENKSDAFEFWKILQSEKICWIAVLDDVLMDGELISGR